MQNNVIPQTLVVFDKSKTMGCLSLQNIEKGWFYKARQSLNQQKGNTKYIKKIVCQSRSVFRHFL